MRIRTLTLTFTLAVLAAMLFTTGCGSSEQNVKSYYTQDGYMGISNANPNMRSNPAHHTYTKDRQLMRQALREMGLDKRSNIVINGTYVTVTINAPGVTPAQAEAIRSDAYSMLKGHNPRYNYRILVR
jgi:fructose-1,6-bisphosphatase